MNKPKLLKSLKRENERSDLYHGSGGSAVEIQRHSTEHVMAMAIMRLWPKAQRGVGPAVEDGFYQDFVTEGYNLLPDDLPKIEKEMEKIKKEKLQFIKLEKSIDDAIVFETSRNQPFKVEILEDLKKDGETKVTYYQTGEYIDLCRGPHIADTSMIGFYKLDRLAGAYWRGDEKRPMLQRLYGLCSSTKEELEKRVWQIEEAKRRDHRKIGEQMEIFAVSEDIGPGLILWLPRGNIIKEELETWAKQTEKGWGYVRVTTPNITKAGLFFTSGHLPYYKNDMYPPMKLDDGEEYYLKPMNCPFHHKIFASKPRSYRDLPLRLAEYGTCYRYESSGELFGLMRVRGFTQNDSHIYCSLGQAVDEFVSVMKLHEYYYKVLGISEYHLELCLRDPKNTKKYHGNEKMWELAEELMRQAVARTNIPMVETVGTAAFYGPKIDFIVKSSIGREFAVSTNQIDLYMGPRFNLKYTDKEGKEQTPVIIHRAPLGSHERFIGFLIEHYGGAFPLWLSPVQVKIIPISERHLEYAKSVEKTLSGGNLRVEVDERNETMQAKIRDAQLMKIPYMLIVGDKEKETDKVSVRLRSGEDLGAMPLGDLIVKLQDSLAKRSLL